MRLGALEDLDVPAIGQGKRRGRDADDGGFVEPHKQGLFPDVDHGHAHITRRRCAGENRLNNNHGDIQPVVDQIAHAAQPFHHQVENRFEIRQTVHQLPSTGFAAIHGDGRYVDQEVQQSISDIVDEKPEIDIKKWVQRNVHDGRSHGAHSPHPGQRIRHCQAPLRQRGHEVNQSGIGIENVGRIDYDAHVVDH